MTLNSPLLTFTLGVLVPPPNYFHNNGRFKGRVDFATTTTAITLVAETIFGKIATTFALSALLLYGVYSLGKRIFTKKNPDSPLTPGPLTTGPTEALRRESELNIATNTLLSEVNGDTPE